MFSSENVYHVLPTDDIIPHTEFCIYEKDKLPVCGCDCKPEHRQTENGCLIIIHNSYDGREGVEWANEILKTK